MHLMDIRVLSVRLHRTQRRLRPSAMFYFYMPVGAATLRLSMDTCNVLTSAVGLGYRQHDAEASASSATRTNAHGATQGCDALSHSQEAERLSPRISFSRKTNTVVVDQQTQTAVLALHPQAEVFCLRMFSYVVQGFLHRTINRDFNLVVHFPQRLR